MLERQVLLACLRPVLGCWAWRVEWQCRLLYLRWVWLGCMWRVALADARLQAELEAL